MILRVLGVDPGLASTGVGAVERGADGKWRALGWRKTTTSAATPMPDRLAKIYTLVHEAIVEFKPTVLGIEDIFVAKNVRSAMAMAHGRGAALLAAAHTGVAVRMLAPREIKLAVAGSGRASKEQLRRLVGIHLGLKTLPTSEHESDALAAALCAAFREGGVLRAAPTRRRAQTDVEPSEEQDPRKVLLGMAQRRRLRRR